MNRGTIDTAVARRLVEASALRGAAVVGVPGGWSVLLKIGMEEKALAVQRTGKPRLWRSLDRCIDYLKTELSIVRVELDASNYSAGLVTTRRSDAAERLRAMHAAVKVK